jgi:phosphohistidine phosphatase
MKSMSRELMLFRHGKSDWSERLDDFDRPLKERGRQGAQRMGAWLQQQALVPDYVVSSPAERAIATAQFAVMAMGLDARGIVQDRRIYAARVQDLLQVLANVPQSARRVLLVGHNPGLEELTEYLQGGPLPLPSDGKLLPTATLANIELPDEWRDLKPGSGRLTGLTRPGSLPKQFPYPDQRGQQLRERPAYYYRQASVVPYRLLDGDIEILMVMSRKRKRWILPKGICGPALGPQACAAQEAFEEAGAQGEVGEQALGSYRYEKWGGECTVDVFPMRVTRLLDEADWQESHRGRQWVSPKQALKQLKQPELKAMIKSLVARLEEQGDAPE